MLNDRTLIKDLAGMITATDYFARAQTGALFRYADGVYAEGGEFFIRQQVKHLLLEHISRTAGPGTWQARSSSSSCSMPRNSIRGPPRPS
jgi:hypothetical protein